MSELINRQMVIDALKKISFSYWFECGEYLSEDTREMKIISSNKALEVIEMLPSAQPEIIRCKECKHRDKYGCCKYWKGLAMGDIPIATDDYDFCSYAEQKGEQCDGKL